MAATEEEEEGKRKKDVRREDFGQPPLPQFSALITRAPLSWTKRKELLPLLSSPPTLLSRLKCHGQTC